MYAVGKRAWGRCERCGDRYLLRELRFDGQQPDLLVCEPCWDPKHPQERLPDVTDPVTLLDPTGDNETPVANLQTVEYPPLIDGQVPVMLLKLNIAMQPSAAGAELIVGDFPPPPEPVKEVTTMGMFGQPDGPPPDV